MSADVKGHEAGSFGSGLKQGPQLHNNCAHPTEDLPFLPGFSMHLLYKSTACVAMTHVQERTPESDHKRVTYLMISGGCVADWTLAQRSQKCQSPQ